MPKQSTSSLNTSLTPKDNPNKIKIRAGKKNPLTLKQEKYCQAYIKHDGNATQAALDSYDTTDYSTASNIGWENLEKREIIQRIEELANAKGLDSAYWLDRLKEHSVATHFISTGKKGLVEVPDNPARGEAIKMGLKIHGLRDTQQAGINGLTANILNIGLDASSLTKFDKILDGLSRINAALLSTHTGNQDGIVSKAT